MAGHERRIRAVERALLTRSPVYVLTLATGVVTVALGWAVGTLFERTVIALTADIEHVLERLPDWADHLPATTRPLGAVVGVVALHGWLIGRRQFRRLALVEAALATGYVLSSAGGELVLAVQRPEVRALFERLAEAGRTVPTDPVVAALLAALVLVRPWIPERSRSAVFLATGLWMMTGLGIVDDPPYLGIVLDVGVGLVAGSVVALVFRTPNLQPDRPALTAALGTLGLDVAELERADVDARGSEPWIGTTVDGTGVFVKALSTDQRAADLLFRAMRWLRLRRAGDAPPEMSLKRAAEHEAMVAQYARNRGIATPPVVGIVGLGPRQVAIVYEAVHGRSLSRLSVSELHDDLVERVWQLVLDLHRHRIAHRDLRLDNVFVRDDGQPMLIDFGFAEIGADDQLLGTDVAELLAATGAVLGPDRAVAVAARVCGPPALDRARDWLHPLALTAATRAAVAETQILEPLRATIDEVTGHTTAEYEPLARLSPSRLMGSALVAIGFYSLLSLVVDDDVAGAAVDIRWDLALAALVVGATAPLLTAAGFRAVLARRVPRSVALRAALATEAPMPAATCWSWTSRALSDAARREGVQAVTAKRAAADWTAGGLAAGPLLVGAFTASGLFRSGEGVRAVAAGLAATVVFGGFQLVLLRLVPGARELERVWIRPYLGSSPGDRLAAGPMLWAGMARGAQGTAFALAARAAGASERIEILAAVGVVAMAIAALLPAPGGIGAVEAVAYLLLVGSAGSTIAALAAVVARILTFWVHVPFAAWAHWSLRRTRPSRASSEPTVARPAVSTGPRSWWA